MIRYLALLVALAAPGLLAATPSPQPTPRIAPFVGHASKWTTVVAGKPEQVIYITSIEVNAGKIPLTVGFGATCRDDAIILMRVGPRKALLANFDEVPLVVPHSDSLCIYGPRTGKVHYEQF